MLVQIREKSKEVKKKLVRYYLVVLDIVIPGYFGYFGTILKT